MEHFSRNIHGAHIFNQCFPVCYTGNIVSSVSFSFQDSNSAYVRYTARDFDETPSMRAVAKFCEHQQICIAGSEYFRKYLPPPQMLRSAK